LIIGLLKAITLRFGLLNTEYSLRGAYLPLGGCGAADVMGLIVTKRYLVKSDNDTKARILLFVELS